MQRDQRNKHVNKNLSSFRDGESARTTVNVNQEPIEPSQALPSSNISCKLLESPSYRTFMKLKLKSMQGNQTKKSRYSREVSENKAKEIQ